MVMSKGNQRQSTFFFVTMAQHRWVHSEKRFALLTAKYQRFSTARTRLDEAITCVRRYRPNDGILEAPKHRQGTFRIQYPFLKSGNFLSVISKPAFSTHPVPAFAAITNPMDRRWIGNQCSKANCHFLCFGIPVESRRNQNCLCCCRRGS